MLSALFNLLCFGSFATFGLTCSLINKLCCARCGRRFPAIEACICNKKPKPIETRSICTKSRSSGRSSFQNSIPKVEELCECDSVISLESNGSSSHDNVSITVSYAHKQDKKVKICSKYGTPTKISIDCSKKSNASTCTCHSQPSLSQLQMQKSLEPVLEQVDCDCSSCSNMSRSDSCYLLKPSSCVNSTSSKSALINFTQHVYCTCNKVLSSEEESITLDRRVKSLDGDEFDNISGTVSEDIDEFLINSKLKSNQSVSVNNLLLSADNASSSSPRFENSYENESENSYNNRSKTRSENSYKNRSENSSEKSYKNTPENSYKNSSENSSANRSENSSPLDSENTSLKSNGSNPLLVLEKPIYPPLKSGISLQATNITPGDISLLQSSEPNTIPSTFGIVPSEMISLHRSPDDPSRIVSSANTQHFEDTSSISSGIVALRPNTTNRNNSQNTTRLSSTEYENTESQNATGTRRTSVTFGDSNINSGKQERSSLNTADFNSITSGIVGVRPVNQGSQNQFRNGSITSDNEATRPYSSNNNYDDNNNNIRQKRGSGLSYIDSDTTATGLNSNSPENTLGSGRNSSIRSGSTSKGTSRNSQASKTCCDGCTNDCCEYCTCKNQRNTSFNSDVASKEPNNSGNNTSITSSKSRRLSSNSQKSECTNDCCEYCSCNCRKNATSTRDPRSPNNTSQEIKICCNECTNDCCEYCPCNTEKSTSITSSKSRRLSSNSQKSECTNECCEYCPCNCGKNASSTRDFRSPNSTSQEIKICCNECTNDCCEYCPCNIEKSTSITSSKSRRLSSNSQKSECTNECCEYCPCNCGKNASSTRDLRSLNSTSQEIKICCNECTNDCCEYCPCKNTSITSSRSRRLSSNSQKSKSGSSCIDCEHDCCEFCSCRNKANKAKSETSIQSGSETNNETKSSRSVPSLKVCSDDCLAKCCSKCECRIAKAKKTVTFCSDECQTECCKKCNCSTSISKSALKSKTSKNKSLRNCSTDCEKDCCMECSCAQAIASDLNAEKRKGQCISICTNQCCMNCNCALTNLSELFTGRCENCQTQCCEKCDCSTSVSKNALRSSRSLKSANKSKGKCNAACQNDCCMECNCAQTNPSELVSGCCEECQTDCCEKCDCATSVSKSALRSSRSSKSANKSKRNCSTSCDRDCCKECNCAQTNASELGGTHCEGCQTECCEKCNCATSTSKGALTARPRSSKSAHRSGNSKSCSASCQKDCCQKCNCSQTNPSELASRHCEGCQTDCCTKCKCAQTSPTNDLLASSPANNKCRKDCTKSCCVSCNCGQIGQTAKNRCTDCQTECCTKCDCTQTKKRTNGKSCSDKCQTDCCLQCTCAQTSRSKMTANFEPRCQDCQTECCANCTCTQTNAKIIEYLKKSQECSEQCQTKCCIKCECTQTKVTQSVVKSKSCSADCTKKCCASCQCGLRESLFKSKSCGPECQKDCCTQCTCIQTKTMEMETVACKDCQTKCCSKCSCSVQTKPKNKGCSESCQVDCCDKCKCAQTKPIKRCKSCSMMILKRRRVIRKCCSSYSIPCKDTIVIKGNFQRNSSTCAPLKFVFQTNESDNLVRVHQLSVKMRKCGCGCECSKPIENTPVKCCLKLKVNS